MRGLLFVWLGLGLASTAEAQTRRSVLVLRLEHPGLAQGLAEEFDGAVRSAVKRALPRHTLLPAPEIDFSALQRAAGCVADDRACLSGIGRTLDASQVVRVRLTGTGNQVQMTVERVRTRGGRATRYETELGELDPQSAVEVGWHVERAFGGNPAPLVGQVELVLEGSEQTLEGAQILVDDRPVSVDELAKIPAGDRSIEVAQVGFEPFVWHGRVRPGRTTQVAVRWVPRGVSPPNASSESVPDTVALSGAAGTPGLATRVEDEGGSGYAATWILGSATVVAASVSTVLAVMVLDREKEAERMDLQCRNGDRDNPTCSSGRQRALWTNVGWGVTAALGVATVTALLLEWPSEPEDPQIGFGLTEGGAAATFQMTFP